MTANRRRFYGRLAMTSPRKRKKRRGKDVHAEDQPDGSKEITKPTSSIDWQVGPNPAAMVEQSQLANSWELAALRR
jgi:hypothetical protein